MKKTMKRFLSMALAVVTMIVTMAAPILSSPTVTMAATSWPYLSTSAYMEITLQNNVPMYANSSLKTRGTSSPYKAYSSAYGAKGDVCYVYTVTNSYSKLSYPTSSGYKTAFCSTRTLFGVNAPTGKYTSNGSATVYKYAGSVKYGSIAKGDALYPIRLSGKYTLVAYSAKASKRSMKAGWVLTSTFNNLIKTSPTTTKSSSITVFSQSDSRWKNVSYGHSDKACKNAATLSSSGCGILSMVNAVYYLTGGQKFIEPKTLAKYSEDNGYRVCGVGTSHGLYKAFCNNYGNTYGIKYTSYLTTSNVAKVKDHLSGNGVCIISVPNHLMALVDYKDGKYLVLDSYPSSTRKTTSGYRWMTANEFTGKMAVSAIICIAKK